MAPLQSDAGEHGAFKPALLSRVRSSGWLLAAAPAAIIAWVLVYPIASNIWTSLHRDRLSPTDGLFVGLLNYQNLLAYGDLIGILGNTLVWTIGGMTLQFLIGFAAALALDMGGRESGILRAILLTPWIMPGVVAGAIWLAIYNPNFGIANSILAAGGMQPVDLLGTPDTAMPAVILANVWKGFPFWMIMIAAALKTIPKELYEAARMDGATYPQQVRHVILPSIRVTLGLTAVLGFIWTFNYFDLIYTLTRGGPGDATSTIPLAIWQTSFKFFRFDQGATLSVVSVALLAIAIAVYVRATRLERSLG